MDKQLVANYLKTLKAKTGLTYGDIADKSGRSESSVKNLFFANVDDPRVDTVAPIVYTLGGSMDEMLNPGKSKDELKEISVVQLREMYESQITTMKETNEIHINNIRAHYEQHRQDYKENVEKRFTDKREIIQTKDEHIKMLNKVCLTLGASFGVCLFILIGLLIAEVMNPNLGWIQF